MVNEELSEGCYAVRIFWRIVCEKFFRRFVDVLLPLFTAALLLFGSNVLLTLPVQTSCLAAVSYMSKKCSHVNYDLLVLGEAIGAAMRWAPKTLS